MTIITILTIMTIMTIMIVMTIMTIISTTTTTTTTIITTILTILIAIIIIMIISLLLFLLYYSFSFFCNSALEMQVPRAASRRPSVWPLRRLVAQWLGLRGLGCRVVRVWGCRVSGFRVWGLGSTV